MYTTTPSYPLSPQIYYLYRSIVKVGHDNRDRKEQSVSDADIDNPHTPLAALIAAERNQPISTEEEQDEASPSLSTEEMMDMTG